MNNEYKQSIVRNDQLNKFNIIDNSIKSEAAMKRKLFKTMTDFRQKAKRMYEEKEEKKNCQKYLKEKEFERFKEDAREMDNQLNRIMQNRLKKEAILPEETYKNYKLSCDNSAICKENNANLIKLETMKRNIRARDYDTAITHFKEQSIRYKSSYNQYNKLLKEFTELQGIYSVEGEELRKVQSMIESKMQKESLIIDDPIIIELQKEINEKNEEMVLVTQKCEEMELIIKKIFIFINSYQKETMSIMKSILINNAKLTVFNCSHFDIIIKRDFDNKESTEDISQFTTTKRIERDDYNNNGRIKSDRDDAKSQDRAKRDDYKTIIKCLLKYLRTWNVIYFNLHTDLKRHFFAIKRPKITEGNVAEFNITENADEDFETDTKEKRIKINDDRLAEEKNIKTGMIHSKKQLDKMKFDSSNIRQFGTIEDIFTRFLINYNRRMSEAEAIYSQSKNKSKLKEITEEKESMGILVSKLRNKFHIHLSGYTNELVEKYQPQKPDYSSLHLTNSNNENIKRQLEKRKTVIQGMIDLIKKNASSGDQKDISENELEDSYHEDMQKPISSNKKGNKFHYYQTLYSNRNTNSPNTSLLNRINDLHKLNFEMFHNRSNKMVYDDISSVCTKTMNSKSFFKLMKNSMLKGKGKRPTGRNKKTKSNRMTIRANAITTNNNRTETTDTNNRTTVTNDKACHQIA